MESSRPMILCSLPTSQGCLGILSSNCKAVYIHLCGNEMNSLVRSFTVKQILDKSGPSKLIVLRLQKRSILSLVRTWSPIQTQNVQRRGGSWQCRAGVTSKIP